MAAKGDALHFVFDLSPSLNIPLESRKLAGLTNREADERNRRHPDGQRVVLKGRGERLLCALHKAYRKHSLALSLMRYSKRRRQHSAHHLLGDETDDPAETKFTQQTDGRRG